MRHGLDKRFQILIPQLQLKRNASSAQQYFHTGLKFEFGYGRRNGFVDHLPQIWRLGPYAPAARQEEHRQESRLLGIAPSLEFSLESMQVGIVHDAQVKGLFKRLSGLMFS